ncbi:MAG TPA: hypothetical protein VJH21_02910 [Candidatus Paceibacterota bacterium]
MNNQDDNQGVFGSFFSRYPSHPPEHYYGDIVRKLFLAGGIVLLITIPLDTELLNFYLSVGVITALLLALFAGFTSPWGKIATIGNIIIATVVFLIFEYLALGRYATVHNLYDVVFMLRQLLAFIFIIAVYFSAKTLRSFLHL